MDCEEAVPLEFNGEHDDHDADYESDEASRDSSSTSASVASSIVAISLTSSGEDEDDDHVTPSSNPRKKIRVIQSDSDEPDCPQPPKKIKKKSYKRIKAVKDNSSSESEQESQPSASRSRSKRSLSESSDSDIQEVDDEAPTRRRNVSPESSDSDVQEIEDEEKAPARRSRRLREKRNPRSESESSETEYNIEFEDGSEDDPGSERSYDSSEESDDDSDSDSGNQCYICSELDKDLQVLKRKGSSVSTWCKCKCCASTDDLDLGDYDRICCQELRGVRTFMAAELELRKKCITEYPRFATDVLKFQALKRKGTSKAFKSRFKSRCFRAQWCFLRMVYDKIGFGEQIVIPACVLKAILKRFGNDGLKHNWYAKYHCEQGPHCHNMQLRKDDY